MRLRHTILLVFVGMMCCAACLAAPEEAALVPTAAALLRAAPSAAAFPNADAYWLRREENTVIQSDGTSRSVYHNTVRILNQRGLDNADISIPYDSAGQSVVGVEARTIRPDGQVLRMEAGDIHETSPYSEYTEYNDAKNVAFSMPGVEPGAILDYRYTLVTHSPLCRGRFSDSVWLAEADPGRLSRYTLTAPASLRVSFRTHNGRGVRFTQQSSADGRRRVYQWESRDNPDIAPEPSMPPEESYLPWLEVTTWPSWQSVAAWYQDLAAPRMTATPSVAALARRLTAGKTSERDRGQAIFYWVEHSTRYVALELGLSAYQPHAAATVLQNRYGDCKDMATLMVALLHAAGIRTAWPVLLDTENTLPRHDHLATPDLFDHVIVRADLDGRPYWFDATAALCTFGDIPGSDRGLEGLVVRDGAGTFETLPQGGTEENRTVTRKTVTLSADGSADCRTVVQSEGDAALSDREEFGSLKPSQLADHFASLISAPASVRLVKYTLSRCDDPGTPVTYGVRYAAPAWATRSGRLMIVSDGFSCDLPDVSRQRRYPLCLDDAQQVDFTTTIRVPRGYTVETLPNSAQEDTAAGTFAVSYAYSGGVVTIHKSVALRPATISVSAYPSFRAACDKFSLLFQQPLVLRPVDLEALNKN